MQPCQMNSLLLLWLEGEICELWGLSLTRRSWSGRPRRPTLTISSPPFLKAGIGIWDCQIVKQHCGKKFTYFYLSITDRYGTLLERLSREIEEGRCLYCNRERQISIRKMCIPNSMVRYIPNCGVFTVAAI